MREPSSRGEVPVQAASGVLLCFGGRLQSSGFVSNN